MTDKLKIGTGNYNVEIRDGKARVSRVFEYMDGDVISFTIGVPLSPGNSPSIRTCISSPCRL